jgi:G3E family GTPase
MADRIIVDILTGFLGSGKTTLLNRLLKSPGFENAAVIVNELGDIGLDHLLVEQRFDQIALLEGGCLCCAVVDSLPETMLELIRRRAGGELPQFTRILIETTGLADPGPIVEVIRRSPLLAYFLTAGVVVTVIDAILGVVSVERHPEALAQVLLADRIILTKLDLRDGWRADETEALQAINPLAEIITAAEVEQDCPRLVAPALHQNQHIPSVNACHSHGITAWHFPIKHPVTQSGLVAWTTMLVASLGPALLRCKGIVTVAGTRMLVQGVGPRFTFEPAPTGAVAAATGLTCIVQNTPRETIEQTLHWLDLAEGTPPPAPEEFKCST